MVALFRFSLSKIKQLVLQFFSQFILIKGLPISVTHADQNGFLLYYRLLAEKKVAIHLNLYI